MLGLVPRRKTRSTHFTHPVHKRRPRVLITRVKLTDRRVLAAISQLRQLTIRSTINISIKLSVGSMLLFFERTKEFRISRLKRLKVSFFIGITKEKFDDKNWKLEVQSWSLLGEERNLQLESSMEANWSHTCPCYLRDQAKQETLDKMIIKRRTPFAWKSGNWNGSIFVFR